MGVPLGGLGGRDGHHKKTANEYRELILLPRQPGEEVRRGAGFGCPIGPEAARQLLSDAFSLCRQLVPSTLYIFSWRACGRPTEASYMHLTALELDPASPKKGRPFSAEAESSGGYFHAVRLTLLRLTFTLERRTAASPPARSDGCGDSAPV